MKSAKKKSSSPAAFTDVERVMKLAIQRYEAGLSSLVYELPNSGQCINFIMRCNRWRNMQREMVAEQMAGIPGQRGQTVYDVLVIRKCDANGESNAKSGRFAYFDAAILKGKLQDPDGNEVLLPEEAARQEIEDVTADNPLGDLGLDLHGEGE